MFIPNKIRRKGENPLNLKYIAMIDPATVWFEIKQYEDKQSNNIANIL